jgi:hypothetical protein
LPAREQLGDRQICRAETGEYADFSGDLDHVCPRLGGTRRVSRGHVSTLLHRHQRLYIAE